MFTTAPERLQALGERLKKYANHNASDAFTADDLYQVAVEEILKSGKDGDNDTYLLRLANWRMLDCIRDNNDENSYTVSFELEEENGTEYANSESTEDAVIKSELAENLRRALSNMSEEARRIVAMLEDGKSQYEIAREIGCSQVSVSNKVKKIRQVFAPCLA